MPTHNPIEERCESILCALRFHVRNRGEQVAYTFLKSDDERQTLTYRQLDERARGIAQELLQHAIPGDRALMAYPAGLEFIAAFLGCLYAGIVAVPAYPPKKNRNADRVLAIADDCQPKLILCTTETSGNVLGDFANAVLGSIVLATDTLGCMHGGMSHLGFPEIQPGHLALLQYTSGSTAVAKGVMVTHGNIVANELLIQRYFEFSHSSVMVSWLPMFHDMGLIGGILAPLFVGFHSIVMAPNTFLTEPVKWLSAVTEFKGTTTGAPNFAYDLCVRRITADQRKSLDLSSLRIAYNGAEPVRAETLEQFSQAFAECGFRAEACFPCYGMAETTLLVSGGPPLKATTVVSVDPLALEQHRLVETPGGQRIVSCGQVGPDMEVRVVDPETGVECWSDRIGELWVSGDSVAQGYLHRSDETRAAFQAKLMLDERNWLRTGDYGFLRDGELFVTGRLKDLLIIRGRNIYPQDIEQLAEQHLCFLEPNACAAFSVDCNGEEKMVVVAEGTRPMVRWRRDLEVLNGAACALNDSIDKLRSAAVKQFEVALADLVFLRPGSFPRTSSGKVQRGQCRALYLNGTADIVFVTAQ